MGENTSVVNRDRERMGVSCVINKGVGNNCIINRGVERENTFVVNRENGE